MAIYNGDSIKLFDLYGTTKDKSSKLLGGHLNFIGPSDCKSSTCYVHILLLKLIPDVQSLYRLQGPPGCIPFFYHCGHLTMCSELDLNLLLNCYRSLYKSCMKILKKHYSALTTQPHCLLRTSPGLQRTSWRPEFSLLHNPWKVHYCMNFGTSYNFVNNSENNLVWHLCYTENFIVYFVQC